MEGVTASAVSAQASNHSIQADEVTTQGRLELRTTNGSVRFERLLPGLSGELVTTNGTVCGTVLDRLEEYTIESRTTNATSNLPERFNGGPKSLTVSTTNGKIDVQFIG